MSQLIRLVYASRSTFMPSERHQGLDPGVARILAKSRKNNAKQQIVGGLLFGDGCFLQCLEGEEQVVETLYTKIESDRRHRDVQVLSRQKIDQKTFGAWSMKYVRGEEVLSDALRSWGMTRFDPYVLSSERLREAVDLMRERSDSADTVPGEIDDASLSEPVPLRPERIVSELTPTPRGGQTLSAAPAKGFSLRPWMAGLAVLALGIGAAVIWRLS